VHLLGVSSTRHLLSENGNRVMTPMEEGKAKRKVRFPCYRCDAAAARWLEDLHPSRPVHQESV